MSKRKITILIIVLIILAILAFLFFYFYKGKTTPTNNGGDTNTYAGFGNNTNNPSDNGTPTDISGTNTGENTGAVPPKLRKVSSMPIAGFGIFTKERYKIVPVVPTPSTDTTSTGTNTEASASTNTDTSDTSKTATATPTPIPKVTDLKNTKNSAGTESVTAVRYVARATGNIYENFADILNEQKFSSTIIPQIYDAYFDSKAESVVMRYLKDDLKTIETFAGTLPKEVLGVDPDGTAELKGKFLPENVTDISLSADLSKIFYLFNTSDSTTGMTTNISGGNASQIFNSPFTEWLSMWPNANMVTLTTKPTSGLPGYMYAINPSKKDFTKILSGINGLTTLTSPDGKNVLYSNNTLKLGIYNIDKQNVTPVALQTMSEKCVWGKASDIIYCAVPKSIPQGSYPDSWYKGQVSFSDQIWKINVKDGSTVLLVDPLTIVGGEDLDGIKLALDKDQKYLFFINKKDSFLWEFNLN